MPFTGATDLAVNSREVGNVVGDENATRCRGGCKKLAIAQPLQQRVALNCLHVVTPLSELLGDHRRQHFVQ